jgi:hypothetical protein
MAGVLRVHSSIKERDPPVIRIRSIHKLHKPTAIRADFTTIEAALLPTIPGRVVIAKSSFLKLQDNNTTSLLLDQSQITSRFSVPSVKLILEEVTQLQRGHALMKDVTSLPKMM